MAQEDSHQDQTQISTRSTTHTTARLTLRKRVRGITDFGQTLRTTLQAAKIAAVSVPVPPNPPGRGRCRTRLEKRPWWPAYLERRGARLAAEQAAATDPPDVPPSLTLRERFLAKAARA